METKRVKIGDTSLGADYENLYEWEAENKRNLTQQQQDDDDEKVV